MSNIDEDLSSNPEKYGFCSFADFRKNPDKWRPKKDQLLRSIDVGVRGETLSKNISGHRYFLEGYRCDSLEKVEDLAKNMGIRTSDLTCHIVRQKDLAGKERLDIHLMSKDTVDKRKTW